MKNTKIFLYLITLLSITIQIVPMAQFAKKAARKTAEEQLKERNIDPQLVSDCIKVLQKLGTDKRQAKYIVNTEFGKDNPPTSVQIFLQKAFKQ